MRLRLEKASIMVDATLQKALEIGCKPLTVAVLDEGGVIVAMKRQDGSSLLRPEIAIGKAWGALGMGIPSRKLGEMAAERPTFFTSIIAASGGRLVPMPGGVLIISDGEIIGAIGVSGDTPDRDEECAVAGVHAAELEPKIG